MQIVFSSTRAVKMHPYLVEVNNKVLPWQLSMLHFALFHYVCIYITLVSESVICALSTLFIERLYKLYIVSLNILFQCIYIVV